MRIRKTIKLQIKKKNNNTIRNIKKKQMGGEFARETYGKIMEEAYKKFSTLRFTRLGDEPLNDYLAECNNISRNMFLYIKNTTIIEVIQYFIGVFRMYNPVIKTNLFKFKYPEQITNLAGEEYLLNANTEERLLKSVYVDVLITDLLLTIITAIFDILNRYGVTGYNDNFILIDRHTRGFVVNEPNGYNTFKSILLDDRNIQQLLYKLGNILLNMDNRQLLIGLVEIVRNTVNAINNNIVLTGIYNSSSAIFSNVNKNLAQSESYNKFKEIFIITKILSICLKIFLAKFSEYLFVNKDNITESLNILMIIYKILYSIFTKFIENTQRNADVNEIIEYIQNVEAANVQELNDKLNNGFFNRPEVLFFIKIKTLVDDNTRLSTLLRINSYIMTDTFVLNAISSALTRIITNESEQKEIVNAILTYLSGATFKEVLFLNWVEITAFFIKFITNAMTTYIKTSPTVLLSTVIHGLTGYKI